MTLIHNRLEYYFDSLCKLWLTPMMFRMNARMLCSQSTETLFLDICSFVSKSCQLTTHFSSPFAYFDRFAFPFDTAGTFFTSSPHSFGKVGLQGGFQIISNRQSYPKSVLAKRKRFPCGSTPPIGSVTYMPLPFFESRLDALPQCPDFPTGYNSSVCINYTQPVIDTALSTWSANLVHRGETMKCLAHGDVGLSQESYEAPEELHESHEGIFQFQGYWIYQDHQVTEGPDKRTDWPSGAMLPVRELWLWQIRSSQALQWICTTNTRLSQALQWICTTNTRLPPSCGCWYCWTHKTKQWRHPCFGQLCQPHNNKTCTGAQWGINTFSEQVNDIWIV